LTATGDCLAALLQPILFTLFNFEVVEAISPAEIAKAAKGEPHRPTFEFLTLNISVTTKICDKQ
jgi:hypothetical protein